MIAASGGPPLSTASEKNDGRVQTAATVSAGGESGLETTSGGFEYSSEDVGGIGLAVQGDEAAICRGADGDACKTDVSIAKKEVLEGEDEPASASSEDYSALSAKIFGLDFTTVSIYPLSNYTFGKKETESRGQEARGVSAEDIRKHRELRFQDRGMRRSVAAILLVHSHSFPHVLLLQRTAGNGGYALPGGRLRPGESAENGLRRKLSAKLSPAHSVADAPEWDIGEQVCKWWAIDHSGREYPYVPAHVTKPTEEIVVYSVSLPEKCMFAVPSNLQLVAVPLFELFANSREYGSIISSVPAVISRFQINCC